ncbi:Tyrosine-protein kinase yes, partial [Taenia solium]
MSLESVRWFPFSDAEWWFVEHCRTSEKGYVPSSYVAVAGSLEAEEWYIPRISRKDSERLLLLNSNTPGTFMIRDSETAQDPSLPPPSKSSLLAEVDRTVLVRQKWKMLWDVLLQAAWIVSCHFLTYV